MVALGSDPCRAAGRGARVPRPEQRARRVERQESEPAEHDPPDSAFHYTLDAAPSEVQEYYREALPQAGWEPRMDEFVTGEYSMFTCSRYGEAVIIYVSPYDAGTIVSILS